MLNLFKKKEQNANISETFFECKRDGLTIRGTEYRPAGEKLPIAIVSHGFMAFQDTVRHYAKLFAELGFAAYCFDFNGGFVSALTAAKWKEQIAKLVLFYPALCIPDDARSGKMMFAKFDPNNIPEIVNCGPMKLGRCYVADVIGMDPFEEIKAYPGEVLFVHGTADNIVDWDYAKRAYL